MGKCKTEAIQTDFITLSHNQAYPEIIQAYSKPCVTMAQRGISRTLTYSKSETYSEIWYIQNPGMFRTLAYSKSKAYSDIYNEAFCENG